MADTPTVVLVKAPGGYVTDDGYTANRVHSGWAVSPPHGWYSESWHGTSYVANLDAVRSTIAFLRELAV